MANYIPNTRVPTVNVYQEIQNSRGREVNEEVDILIPTYIFDRRILRAIELKNLNYLQNYLKKCPRNVERYYFLETVTSLSPMVRSIIVGNLLGYAFLYKATKCVQYLLDMNADPFQPAYFIEWASYKDIERKILLYEAPSVILLSGSVRKAHRTDCVAMLSHLRNSNAQMHLPVTIRRQQFEPPSEPVSSTIRFSDAWECMEKELEKKGGEDLPENKSFLKELKGVYRANKFERLEKVGSSSK
ncbi:unnamed protein product [Calicophoron daubneyi]|uniref:Uncharacterized protein n=1 Tax=Calicophoron daubneyi TaxID=300641 RepID=A0AAV2TH06_CALDB